MPNENDLNFAEASAIAYRIREELARRRMSRQGLADKARISISTLEKALAGKRAFTLATIIRLEQALDTDLRGELRATPARSSAALSAATPSLAPAHLGAYARPTVKWIEGDYLTLRPSFRDSDALFAYITTIGWDDDAGHLIFEETRRSDFVFAQHGNVSMPHFSGHIYLVVNDEGQHRLTILGRPTSDKALYGLLTTLQVGAGSQLVPVSCPIAFIKVADPEVATVGIIAAHHPSYDIYRQRLSIATGDDFAHFRL